MARRASSPGLASAPGARTAAAGRAILCAVLDGDALGPEPREQAGALFAAGVDWIQLRDRAQGGAALFDLARALVAAREATRVAGDGNPNPRVIVNKRLDVALAAEADGVHLGVDAVTAASAAALFAERDAPLIGASLHGLEELERHLEARAPLAYVHLAPIWSPRSKPAERPPLGVETLARAVARAAQAGLPVLAQGGLDPERARAAIAVGAAGIAVTGLLGHGVSAAPAARALRAALDAEPDETAFARASKAAR